MPFPLPLDFPPMEAESAPAIPEGEQWQYEPKWDGFRCLAFRDGERIELRSKSGQGLRRYFPDVAAALLALQPGRFALDGEIVIPVERRLSFEALQLRLHPAESRVRKLAAEHPAVYVAFDLLATAHDHTVVLLVDESFAERRRALEEFVADSGSGAIRLSPSTADRD